MNEVKMTTETALLKLAEWLDSREDYPFAVWAKSGAEYIASLTQRLHNVMTENAMLERDIAVLETEVQRLRNAKACDSCGYVTGTLKKSEVQNGRH